MRRCDCHPPKLLLSISEAAEQLSVSKPTVRALIDAGVLHTVQVSPRNPRVPYRALEEFANQLEPRRAS